MAYTEKMYLVPKHQLDRLHNPGSADPDIRKTAANRLDSEMKEVLNRTDLSPSEKASLYSAVLQKYLTFVRHGKMEKDTLNLFLADADASPTPSEAPPPTDNFVQEIVDNVNPRYKKNTELLLSKLTQHKDLSSWNDKGELVYRGKAILGSNMHDLVRGAIQKHRFSNKNIPRGWGTFLKMLAEINMPSSVLGFAGNRTRLENLKSGAAAPGGTPSPPPSPYFQTPRKSLLSMPSGGAEPEFMTPQMTLPPKKRKHPARQTWLYM